jgi:FkbM family methyltransferase
MQMFDWPVTVAKRSVGTCWRVKDSPLPSPLRQEVLRGLLALDRSRVENIGTLNFLGYKIAYAGEASLRYLIREIFANATYFFEAATDRPTILDCGSNIGMSVLFFKKLYPNARITAFEPDPATFALLVRNIATNNLANVEAHQIALAAKAGTLDFNRDRDPETSSLLMSVNPQRQSGQRIAVEARPLSGYISENIDLLKIDIEGSETDVMHELAASGKLALIRDIHMEYHHHIGSARDNLSMMLRLLEDAGFGYQIAAGPWWSRAGSFQDVSLYCYRR